MTEWEIKSKTVTCVIIDKLVTMVTRCTGVED